MIRSAKYRHTVITILLIISFQNLVNAQTVSETVTLDTLNIHRLRTVVAAESAIYAGGLYVMNNIWYKNHRAVPFHFYNDLKGWNQVDKAGHLYSAYYQSFYGIKALQWAGVNRKKALWYGGSLGLLMQTPIEIFDGLYEGYGFSTSDMIANTAGSALVIGQELMWEEQRIALKFSYHPTEYPRYRPSLFGESSVENFFTDYNGHTYWLSANLSSFLPEKKIPHWLNIAVGYGAEGMLSEFKNPIYYQGTPLPFFERSRQLYISLDIDISRVRTKSSFLKKVLQAMNMIKIPAPAFEYNTAKGISFYPLYF